MKQFFTLGMLFLLIGNIHAQTLGEFKPKDQSYGLGKLKNSNKKIYIAGFTVNFQIYNEKEKFKQGGYQMGGTVKGDAKAAISVGLEGLDEQTIQEITDKLYQDYIAKLKAKGMTIISVDEAAKTEAYEDFVRVKGGKITAAELPGTMSVIPTGYEYLVKGFTKDGKSKKGGFLGNAAMKYPKISKDLGDAIVSNVDLTVLFVRDKEAFQGNGAKLKVKTDLRLVANDAIIMTSDAAIKFKGQNSVSYVQSKVEFYHGKMGMGSTTSYVGMLGKDLMINDVISSEKVTSYAAGSIDGGTKTMYGTYFDPKSGASETTKIIKVEAEKYKTGVYDAASKFMNFHTDEFLKSI